MASLFIAVIYLAFISLGLPDSLFGSARPVMHTELGASLFRGRHQPYHLSFHHRLGALFRHLAISVVQFVLTLIMFLSLPLWKKTAEQNGTEEQEIALPPQKTLCLKGALCLFLAGLFYFAIEQLLVLLFTELMDRAVKHRQTTG